MTRPFNTPKAYENNLRKGENTGYQHFLLFPQCFPPYQRKNLILSYSYILFYLFGLLVNFFKQEQDFFYRKKFPQQQPVASEFYIFAQRLNIKLTFDSRGHPNWFNVFMTLVRKQGKFLFTFL